MPGITAGTLPFAASRSAFILQFTRGPAGTNKWLKNQYFDGSLGKSYKAQAQSGLDQAAPMPDSEIITS